MATSHFRLSSNTYKNRVFEGFSRLQQCDEFVDMTLAAEGHLVKVHRTLIALASPFLKDLLGTVPCQHPVLFLSNISHKILCYILEFVYTGEVNIPCEDVRTFLNAAQAMHITGLENILPPPTDKATIVEEMAKHVFYRDRPNIAKNTLSNHVSGCKTTNIENEKEPIVNDSRGAHPTTFAPDQSKTSGATTAACITIAGLEKHPSTMDNIARDHEKGPYTFPPRLPTARPFLTIDTEFGMNIQQNNEAYFEKENNENAILPTTAHVPTSKKNDQFLSFMNDSTDATKGTNLNIGNSNTDENVSQDPINMAMFGDIKNDNIRRIPMIIEGHVPMGNEGTTTVDYHNNNVDNGLSIENTANSNLLNISSNSLIQDHDMSVDISISDLLDFNHIATPSTTNEINENNSMNNNQTIDLTDCDNVFIPNTGNGIAEESVGNNEMVHGSVETSKPVNEEPNLEATDIEFLNQDQIKDIFTKDPGSMLYAMSNRGSLQVMENNFIYNCHYLRDNGRKRRWRCIDYRNIRCKATFDTVNEEVVTRKYEHCHPNHNEKIYYKVMKRRVFPTIKIALEACKQKNDMTETQNDDDNMSE